MNKLQNVYIIKREGVGWARTSLRNGKFIILILNHPVDETMLFAVDMWRCPSPKMGLQHQKNSPYLTEVQWDISDLPFVQNKEYQSKYLVVELKAAIKLV